MVEVNERVPKVIVEVIMDHSKPTQPGGKGKSLNEKLELPVMVIIDEKVVITGSFTFARAGEEKNGENVVVIRDSAIAKEYLKNWQKHRTIAEPLPRQ